MSEPIDIPIINTTEPTGYWLPDIESVKPMMSPWGKAMMPYIDKATGNFVKTHVEKNKLKAIYGTDQINPSALTDVPGLEAHATGLEVKRRHLSRKIFNLCKTEFGPTYKLKFGFKFIQEAKPFIGDPWHLDLKVPYGVSPLEHHKSLWTFLKQGIVGLHQILKQVGPGSHGGFFLGVSPFFTQIIKNASSFVVDYALVDPEFKQAGIEVMIVTVVGLPLNFGYVFDRHPAILKGCDVLAKIQLMNMGS